MWALCTSVDIGLYRLLGWIYISPLLFYSSSLNQQALLASVPWSVCCVCIRLVALWPAVWSVSFPLAKNVVNSLSLDCFISQKYSPGQRRQQQCWKVETSLEWHFDRSITLSSKIWLMCSFVTSIFLYACELWTLTAELQRRMPWKWGATARYYTYHTKTMLPMRKSVSRSSRQLDHTKISWRSEWDANCSGMVMSPVHQVWAKPSCKAQRKEGGDKADRTRGGKTTSGYRQAWSLLCPRGQWRKEKKWRKLVVKSSVVPQWPSRLRNRWRWRKENYFFPHSVLTLWLRFCFHHCFIIPFP